MKILFAPTIMNLERAIPQLAAKYPETEFVYCHERSAIKTAIADADAFVGWLSREEYLAARKLRWIQSSSTGVNNFLDIPELAASDVILTSARGTHSRCVAESALAMILAYTRGIRESVRSQIQGAWARPLRSNMVELTGKTLGIVGFGSIGRALAQRAQAFEMDIVAIDLNTADKPDYVRALWPAECLADLLKASDFVVVTVPFTNLTRKMISANEIALMKPSALLVGVSRGGIIDEVALAEALREHRIAAAALDVFETEPLPGDNDLWNADNLLITAHIAGGSQYEYKYLLEILDANLARFIAGQRPLRNEIDKLREF